MNNTKNKEKAFKEIKTGKTPRELHELFLQWLTTLLHDEQSRAVIRTLVERHEMPVIDDDTGRTARR